MKKETKEELKQDEVRSFLEHGIEWFSENRDKVRIGGITVVVLAAGIGALSYFQSSRAREAAVALDLALERWSAPVVAAVAGAEKPAGLSYESNEAKHKAALESFDGIVGRYGSRTEGRRAAYYAALCRIELGQTAEAEKALSALVAERAGIESDLAEFALAGLQRKVGNTDKAVELFRRISANPQARVPRDAALASLAALFEQTHKPAEALASYKQLVEEYPASPYAAEARRRSEYLATAVKG